MAFYVKVTKAVSDALGLTAIRNRTADGCVLLWQADLDRIGGDTIFERAAKVGGVALTPQTAREETEGTDCPVEVYTPDEYKEDEPALLPELPDDTPTILPELPEEGGAL